MVVAALFFIIGIGLGWSWREIRELQRHVAYLMEKSAPKATPGPTMGVYNPANETKQSAGIVVPKSPQRIEWENNRQTLVENGLSDIIERNVRPQ